MNDLERYLRLATWSLWGEQKKTVRMELEAHIQHKIWKYQMRGCNHAEALEKTLADLGQPHVISAGMTGVYTMPNMIRKAGLMILLSSLGIGALNAGQAQITGTTTFPTPDCLAGKITEFQVQANKIPCQSRLIWLHKPSLKAVLEKAGVKVNLESNDWEYMSFLFPDSKNRILIRGDLSGTFRDEKGNIIVRGDPMYMSGGVFFDYLPKAGLPVSLEGWDKPTIRVGKTEFTLEQKDSKFSSSMIYFAALYSSLRNLIPSEYRNQFSYLDTDAISRASQRQLPSQQELKIAKSHANTMYVMVSRVTPDTNRSEIRLHEIQPVSEDGIITFHPPITKLQFANSIRDFYQDKKVNAIVYKFSGRLDVYDKIFEVVPASDIQVVQ